METHRPDGPQRTRVVIVGGGFGGLTAAKALGGRHVDVLLLDKSNHHLFQPLLYQVATAGLSPADIAIPIRSVLRRFPNVRVLLAEVEKIDLARRALDLSNGTSVEYDFVILAMGAKTSYFGRDEWSEHTLGLKTIDEAVEIRRRVLLAFERAEALSDPEERRRNLTFVVIGGGPTGVEMAGALRELARVVSKDLRTVEASDARIILVEAGPRILSALPESLSGKAMAQLAELDVDIRVGAPVTEIGPGFVAIGPERIESETVIWAAGVAAIPLTRTLPVAIDRGGRIIVEQDCSIPGHPTAFAIGDLASFLGPDGRPLPGVSPVAMQQARFVAREIVRRVRSKGSKQNEGRGDRNPPGAESAAKTPAFRYFDKGTMATIGRSRAVAVSKGLKLHGMAAWFVWLLVHIFYLVGFKNRVFVLFSWIWSYLSYRRGARLITGPRLPPASPKALAPGQDRSPDGARAKGS